MNGFWKTVEVNVPVPKLSSDDGFCEEHSEPTRDRVARGWYQLKKPF